MTPTRTEAHVLAIDAGSSSVRAALYDERGERIPGSLARVEIDLTLVPGGVAEIAAADMRAALEQAIDGALHAPESAGRDVAIVSMATFWHSLVALDDRGEPLTPVFSWADTRSEPDAVALRAALDDDAVHQRTGCILHPSYLPAKLAWLRRHDPETFDRAASFVSFAQYCTLSWLGSAAASISMASGTGLLDHESGTWDAALTTMLHVDPSMLGQIMPDPELLPPVTGTYLRRWPALNDVPWLAPIGDGAASNVGAGCVGPDRLALMVGTSGALRRCARDEHGTRVPPGLWRYRLDHDYALTGGALSDGGNAYAWLQETFRLPDPAQAETELAQREPGAHGLVVLPFWSGERSTGWVGDATAVVSGLKLHTTPMDIHQAVLEAITYRFAAIFDALRRGGETVVATGGGLRASPAWLQIMADALGTPVVTTTVTEASLTGAARVGLREIGVLSDADLSRGADVGLYEPRVEAHERHLEARWRQQLLYDREIGAGGANLLARQTR